MYLNVRRLRVCLCHLQATVRKSHRGAVKVGNEDATAVLKFAKDLYWTTSRQANQVVWLVYKPDAKALYAYSHRDKRDYPLQHALDYGDLIDDFCAKWANGTLDPMHVGTKAKAGAAYLPKDVVDSICLHVFGARSCNEKRVDCVHL